MNSAVKQKPKAEHMEKKDDDTPDHSESIQAKFEQELMWCIEQLQIGLATQNPNSRQVVDGNRALKILLSTKAPVIKKRQVMRNTFGDYRKKMADMERKSTAAARKGTIASVADPNSQKSTFFKKSATMTCGNVQTIPGNGYSLLTGNQSSVSYDRSVAQYSNITIDDTGLDSSFQFNFKIDDHNNMCDKVCTNIAEESSCDKVDSVSGKVSSVLGKVSSVSDTVSSVSGKVSSVSDTVSSVSDTVSSVSDIISSVSGKVSSVSGKADSTNTGVNVPFHKSDNSFRFNFSQSS